MILSGTKELDAVLNQTKARQVGARAILAPPRFCRWMYRHLPQRIELSEWNEERAQIDIEHVCAAFREERSRYQLLTRTESSMKKYQ